MSGQGKTSSSRRRGRRRGVEIRPGAVKQARQEAGLSLGQVARDDISRTAIYFVETGKAKPSMETLVLIAERTGRPLEFFLGPEATPVPAAKIAELERLLATGANAAAAASGEELLRAKLDPDAAARVRQLAGMANLRLGRPVVARRLVTAAREHFEMSGDVLSAAESMGMEAQAAYLLQESAALPLAEAALGMVRSITPVPPSTEAQLLMVLASVHLMRRSWHEAIALYQEAIAVGDVVQDLHRLSLMYSGLSGAYQELGELGEATRYAQKALTIHETLQDRLSLARSLNNLGYMLVRMGELGSARTHLLRSLRIYEVEGVESGLGYTLTSLCELELKLGNVDGAEAWARQALEISARLGEAALTAEAHMWLGRIAAGRGLQPEADVEFWAALDAVKPLGSGARLSEVHEAFAEILEARGDLAGANDHLKQALAAAHTAPSSALESRIATA